MNTALRILVFGRVQGVCFRASARDEARALGLSGFAKNEPDGSVLMEVEGDSKAVSAFASWANRGSPHARVESVKTTPIPFTGVSGFRIR